MAEAGRVLQLCPHDYPPFADLCVVYARAIEALGCQCVTVFLGPPNGGPKASPVPGAVYLGAAELSRNRSVGRLLANRLDDGAPWRLAVCHRYRAWRVLRSSGLQCRGTVVIAHEFGFFKRPMRRLLARFSRRTFFAGVSPAVVASMEPHAARVICLPNAVDVERERAALLSREEALARLGLEPGPFTVGVVGRLHPKKHPERALLAFHAAALPDARLVFVGDGPLREVLDRSEPNVHFTGFIADARRSFRAFDVLFLTSGEVEAFGMVALEALVAGVPVVCERVAGPLEVLGPLGCYYDRPDAAAMAAALQLGQAATDKTAYATAAAGRVEGEYSIASLSRRLADQVLAHS
jgi:glycosyltransferase involved in cell wall biosynthesis